METKKQSTFNIPRSTSNEPSLRQFLSEFGVECRLLVFSLGLFVFVSPVRAQVNNTLTFSSSGPGVSAAITNWGLDTGWANYDNMYRGLQYMGTNTVNLVQVVFEFYDTVTNDITPQMKLDLTNMVSLASQTSTNARWIMSSGTGGFVTNYYQSGSGTVYPNRWATMMSAWQRNFKTNFPGRTMWMAQGFNEPDYGWGQGSQQNLHDILGYLETSNNFAGVHFGGGCTLDDDLAISWYDFIASRVSIGTTHCLAGTAANYVSFIQSVEANHDIPFNPEVHNLVEVIIGANYGLQGGTWWGTAELARGNFANTCQGQRLGYAENDANWTAAAVYRGTNGAVQAFLGGSERMATTTSYRFFSKDRDVFYDGNGPQRNYDVTVPGGTGYEVNQPGAEKVVNITWGADIQPAINGRYIVVNHNSGKVLEVPGSSLNNGVQLDQNTFTNGLNQLWDINPLPSTFGGDFSYFSIRPAHDGLNMDLQNFSYANGAIVEQWADGTNGAGQWYLQYTTNGYFKIRSGWSTKVVGVNGGSTANGAVVLQWDDTGTLDHEWRLIPAAGVTNYDFVAPAAPTLVTATANAVSVQLNWKTNSEPDLASYTVLRSTNSSGPYEICARGLTNNFFTDKFANQNEPYYYVIRALDRSLNNSANSAQVSAMPSCEPAIVAQYTFDGSFNDSSGNANNPIVLDGSPALVAGKYGSALGLDGTSQDVLLPAGMMASATNFTIAAWVNWNGGAAWQRIFDFGNDTTSYMFLTPSSSSGTLRFGITTNGPGAQEIIETSPLATNQWVHVAATFNGTTCCIYTNGVLATSGSITLNPASFNPALNYLGKSEFTADPLFSGALDEVVVANYAMSAAQIAWLPHNSAPLPALVHRYSFSATSGTVVDDSIGGAAWNGMLPNGGTFSGGKLTLSAASSQYVNLPANILSNYPAVTIEAWATFPDQIAWNTMFFAFGNTIGSSGDNYIFCGPQRGYSAITSTNYLGEQDASYGMDFSFQTNLHVTAIFDPAANYLGVYTNGVLAGVNTAVTDPMNVVSNVFSYIGRSLYPGDVYFDFSIDEFRIYNGVLQPADIATEQLLGPNVLLTTNVSMNVLNSGGSLTMNWPVASSRFTLVSSPTLGTGAVWTPVSIMPNIAGGNYKTTITPTNGTLFFRLQR